MKNGRESIKLKLSIKPKDAMPNFKPTPKSLQRYQTPKWFQDAKFGIFIHWGPYAVPAAFNEWYPRNMYQTHMKEFKWHQRHFGDQKKFGYKDFIPHFKAERWNPKVWADLFAKSGARYVIPVAEHHDSFAMYRSSHTRWNSVDMGPKRDILGELRPALRRRGLKMGASSHLAFNWWYFAKNKAFDTSDPAYADLYGGIHDVKTGLGKLPRKDWGKFFVGTRPSSKFLKLWWLRTTEIMERYKPEIFYFDWCWGQPEWDKLRLKFAAHYYNRARQWGKEAVINYKDENFPWGSAVYDVERGRGDEIRPLPWQTCTALSWKSWCHIQKDDLKSPKSLVHVLCDIVSKRGNLLLNVGPRADGSIPAKSRSILLEIGAWLKINGEAIYGTEPWIRSEEGPTKTPSGGFSENKEFSYTAQDIRFTKKGRFLYAIILGRPPKKIKIRSLGRDLMYGARIRSLEVLGNKGKPKWSQEKTQLEVAWAIRPNCKHALVLKLGVA
jgi:alpha-L-fucosidase